ncbi:hypothetical protein N0V85_008761 [Neurospora sp. IMI 360204]|nr:hypothetical protein N0V85_008761 [Neurospora sp. IMI 360204]
MPKTISDKKAAELLEDFLSSRGGSLYLKNWEQELKAIIQVFVIKYHELSPKAEEPAGTKNCPSKLLHQFFVKSLRNAMNDLPSDVGKLKEAVDALDGKHASRKRRRSDNHEGVKVDIPKGKRAKIEWVSKFTVYTSGSYAIHVQKGQTEVIEFTLDDASILDVKFRSAPGRTITDDNVQILNDKPAGTA